MNTTPSIADPVTLIQALTEEDVLRALDDLARQEKQLKVLLRSIRRRKREDIRHAARKMSPIEEVTCG
jgi:hypothetical protein